MMNTREAVDDELVVLQVQSGDAGAMATLVERWQPRLWALARTLSGDSETAWDVTQETWLAIVQGIDRLHDPARFRAWAFGIVRNKAADRIRWWRRYRALLTARPKEPAAAPAPSVRSEVLDILDTLPRQERELLALHYLEGIGYEELAAMLRVPLGTVKSRLHKARQELRQTLDCGHG